MRSLLLVTAAVTVASTVSAYVCPDVPTVGYACRQLNVFPLVCYNPQLNIKEKLQQHSRNVEGLIHRCGGGFTNPYGNSTQYRPGKGTATFTKTTNGPVATRIYKGTTYYGGIPTVISGFTRIVSATAIVRGTAIFPGITTWVSGTPGIIRGTSTPSNPRPTVVTRYYNGTTYYGGQTRVVSVSGTPGIIRGTSFRHIGTRTGTSSMIPTGTDNIIPTLTHTGGNGATTTAQPILAPSETPVPITAQGISGGAIAGIFLGILGTAILAALLALCWRKKRAAHAAALSSTHIAHEPTRTTVVEKIEPVVVKPMSAAEIMPRLSLLRAILVPLME
ncbi:hypothetical protein BGZ92_003884 [Podila epicladia]|nr:hypothetical protein BGZ92_003884 [Podila epicladia]